MIVGVRAVDRSNADCIGGGGFLRLAKRLLVAMVFLLPWLSGCSDSSQLPKPPLSFPFDTQKAGFKIETDVRIADHNIYEFGFKLAFEEGNATDRARVVSLAGNPERDKNGKLLQPGVPIALRIKISASKPSALESVFEKEFIEEQMNGCSAEHCYTVITSVRLKPGIHHFVIENLKSVTALKGTAVTLYIASDPKASTIPD